MIDVSQVWSKLVGKVSQWIEALLIAAPNILIAIATVVVALWLSRWVQRVVRGFTMRLSHNRPISALLGTASRAAFVLVGVFSALGILNLDKTVTSLLAGVGVVGLALGFAFQDIAANFMAGFILVFSRPFDVGDLVEVNGQLGKVKAVELRATELETLDGLTVIMPNKDVFQNPIVNYTKTSSRRLDFSAGAAYCDDMQKVRRVVIDAVQAVPRRDTARDIEVFFESFADSSINFIVRIWLTAADQRSWLEARSEAMIAIKRAFDREQITIPFPIRTLDFGAKVVGGERLDAMQVGAQLNPRA